MARKPVSRFTELTTTLRRILVLSIAAFGVARGWPYESIVTRVVILWAILYLSCMTIELVFQYLSHSAITAGRSRESANLSGSDGS